MLICKSHSVSDSFNTYKQAFCPVNNYFVQPGKSHLYYTMHALMRVCIAHNRQIPTEDRSSICANDISLR